MESWEELDTLVTNLRDASPEWAESSARLAEQLAAFAAVVEQADRQYDEIGVRETLIELNRRLLNGAGTLRETRSMYGLTRSAVLAWHASDDPRPELRQAPPEGALTVEVRLGPLYLLRLEGVAGGDERPHLVIAGEKRLAARLPVDPARFRAALLHAVRTPGYEGPEWEREPAAQPAADSEESAAGDEDTRDEPEGDGERSSADISSAPQAAVHHEAAAKNDADVNTGSAEATGAEPTGADPDVIELPGQSA